RLALLRRPAAHAGRGSGGAAAGRDRKRARQRRRPRPHGRAGVPAVRDRARRHGAVGVLFDRVVAGASTPRPHRAARTRLLVALRTPDRTRSTARMEEAVRIPVADFTLDARIALPADATSGVVICHPHPQYGGSMENDLVVTLAEAFRARGLATLRF